MRFKAAASAPLSQSAAVATRDVEFMQRALAQAEAAMHEGEVPVGAVLVRDDRVVCAAHNHVEGWRDPTAHAEVLCLRAAALLLGAYPGFDSSSNLSQTTLPSTLRKLALAGLSDVVTEMLHNSRSVCRRVAAAWLHAVRHARAVCDVCGSNSAIQARSCGVWRAQ